MNNLKGTLLGKNVPDQELISLREKHPKGTETPNYFYYKQKSKAKCYNKFFRRYTDETQEKNSDTLSGDTQLQYKASTTKIDEILTLKPYLTEVEISGMLKTSDMDEYLNSKENNYILVSPPNSGKTSSLLSSLINHKKKFIYLVPLRLLVKELKHSIKKKYPNASEQIAFLEYGSYSDLKGIMFKYDSFIGTYDSLIKLESVISNRHEYILIVDEWHKLISDSDYRPAVRFVNSCLYKYGKCQKPHYSPVSGSPYSPPKN